MYLLSIWSIEGLFFFFLSYSLGPTDSNYTQYNAISTQLLFKEIISENSEVRFKIYSFYLKASCWWSISFHLLKILRQKVANVLKKSVPLFCEEDFLKLIHIVEENNENPHIDLAIKVLSIARIKAEKLSQLLYHTGRFFFHLLFILYY